MRSLQFLIVFLFPAIALAQSAEPACGFERVHQGQLATDSLYRSRVGRAVAGSGTKGVTADDELYTIPVVFVVYHVGEAVGTGSNLADAALTEQLALLNRYYAAEAPFTDGVNSRIRFVLAQRSPTCQAGSGIVRVDARSAAGYEANGVTNYTDAVPAPAPVARVWQQSGRPLCVYPRGEKHDLCCRVRHFRGRYFRGRPAHQHRSER